MQISSFNHDAMVKFVWPNPLPILCFQSKIVACNSPYFKTCCMSTSYSYKKMRTHKDI